MRGPAGRPVDIRIPDVAQVVAVSIPAGGSAVATLPSGTGYYMIVETAASGIAFAPGGSGTAPSTGFPLPVNQPISFYYGGTEVTFWNSGTAVATAWLLNLC